jgi:hypothetical protein
MSYTYIIIDTDSYRDEDKSWHVKIGMSGNPPKRLASLRTGNPGKLEIVATIAGSHWEGMLHDMMRRFRLNGEWFRLDMGRIYLLATIASEHDDERVDFFVLERLPKPCMQSADDSCLLEAEAFMEGWGVGEQCERSTAKLVAA